MSNILDFPRAGTARKAVIFVRVSSREQEEGYSIDAQKHRLELYCRRRDLEVLKIFEIVESSTKGDRHKFLDMVKFAKAQKEVVAIVADKVDRVQRSFREYPLLDDLIQRGRIELHFNTENYVIHKDSMSQERLMWSMSVIMAQSYVDSMKDNIRRSFDQKIRMGEYVSRAPLGYMNIREANGRGNIVLDPERAPLVIRLFEEYATGQYTLSEMTEKCKAWGLRNRIRGKNPIGRSYLHDMLNNPFYHGIMQIKGQLYSHRYEPLINKALFDQCQAVMKGWHKKPFKYAGKDFIFRGLITCATTGRVVTASTQKKTYKNGGRAEWTYLRSWNPEDPAKVVWVREDKILAQVEDIFRALHIPDHRREKIIAHVRETDQTERAFLRRQMADLKKDYTAAQTRLDNLMDLLLDGTIDKHDFERKKQALRERQVQIRSCMAAHEEGDDNFKESLITLIQIMSEAGDLFAGSTVEQKRRLVGFLFANLQLKGSSLCYSLAEPFCWFAECRDMRQWWREQDSNLRRHKSADLQSAAINRSAIPPQG